MYRKSPTSADSSRFKFEHRFLAYTRKRYSVEDLKKFQERLDEEIKKRELAEYLADDPAEYREIVSKWPI